MLAAHCEHEAAPAAAKEAEHGAVGLLDEAEGGSAGGSSASATAASTSPLAAAGGGGGGGSGSGSIYSAASTPGAALVVAAEARAARTKAQRALTRDIGRRFFVEMQSDLDRINAFVASALESLAEEHRALAVAPVPEGAGAGVEVRRARLAAERPPMGRCD